MRNPDYFVKGRPYLDGVRYTVIVERGTRVAALQAGQIDVAYPGETTLAIAEQLKDAVPGMVFTETASNVSENLLLNTKKPPFDNIKVRRALSFAIDRRNYTQTVHRGGAVVGASLAPKPWGVWGLLDRGPGQLPGYGGAAAGRAQAKKLLAEAGFGPSNPLKVELVTRAIAIYLDFAGFVVSDLKQVGVEATLKQIDTAQWHPMVTRREFQIGANLTGLGVGRSRRQLLRELLCGSPRNYGDYCNEEVGRLIEQQSQEIDAAEAPGPRLADPEEARGGRGPAHHGLAHRSLRALSRT